MTYASDDSLPDSPLYHVKTAREWLELRMARDAEEQASARARQANQRALELERALQRNKTKPVIEAVVRRVVVATELAVDRALEARASGNPRPAIRTVIAIRAVQRRVNQVVQQSGPEVRPSLVQLRMFLEQQEQRLIEDSAPARQVIRALQDGWRP